MFHISPATVPGNLDRDARAGADIGLKTWQRSGRPIRAEVRDATARGDGIGKIIMRDEPDDAWLRCAIGQAHRPSGYPRGNLPPRSRRRVYSYRRCSKTSRLRGHGRSCRRRLGLCMADRLRLRMPGGLNTWRNGPCQRRGTYAEAEICKSAWRSSRSNRNHYHVLRHPKGNGIRVYLCGRFSGELSPMV